MLLIALIMAAVAALAGRCGDNIAKWLTYVCPVYRLLDFSLGVLLGRLFLISERRESMTAIAAGVCAVVWTALWKSC